SLSKACYNTIDKFYEVPESIQVLQIYPLIYKNPYTTIESIKEKSHSKTLNCLYISSNFNLKGGREILESFKKIYDTAEHNIKLTIITKKKSLDQETLKEIYKLKNTELLDFNLSKEDLNKIYSTNSILLNPSRQDSFSLVVLEAIKSGNTILSTDLY